MADSKGSSDRDFTKPLERLQKFVADVETPSTPSLVADCEAVLALAGSRRRPLADSAAISFCVAVTGVVSKDPVSRAALSSSSSRAALIDILRNRKDDCTADVAAAVLGCLAWIAPPAKCTDLASADTLATMVKLLAAHTADVRVACDCIEVLRAVVFSPGPVSITMRSLGAAAPLTKALELHADRMATAAGAASILGSMAAVVESGSTRGPAAGSGTGRAAGKKPAERGGGCSFAEQARACMLALRKYTGTGTEPSRPRAADAVASLLYPLGHFAALDAGEAIAADGGCVALVAALKAHGAHPGVALHGFTAIAYLDAQRAVHEQLVVAGATEAVVSVLPLHGSGADARSLGIIRKGCAALLKLSDHRATLDRLAAEGVAVCLLGILRNFAGPGEGEAAEASAAAAASGGAGAASHPAAPIPAPSTAAAACRPPPPDLPACMATLCANEVARSQLVEGGAASMLLRMLQLHGGDSELCCAAVSALTQLLAGYDESLAFARLPGAAAAVVATVKRHVGTFAVAGPGSTLMQRLAVTDAGRDALIGAGAGGVVVRVLAEHHTSPLGGLAVRAACLALDKLCFDRGEGARLQADEPLLVPVLIKVLRGFKSDGAVVSPACAVLGKVSAAHPEQLVALKVAPLLVELLQLHAHHEDSMVPAGIATAVHTMAECPPAADAIIAAGGIQAVAGLETATPPAAAAAAGGKVAAAAAAAGPGLVPEHKACLMVNTLFHLMQRPAAGTALGDAACSAAVSTALLRVLRAHKANAVVTALACATVDAATKFPAFCATMGRSGLLPALLSALRAHEANEQIVAAVLAVFDRALGDAECAALLARLDLTRDLNRVLAPAAGASVVDGECDESETTGSVRALAKSALVKLTAASAASPA